MQRAFARYDVGGALSPEVVSCWIASFWIGMEFVMLLGVADADTHYQEALTAMQRLLDQLEQQARPIPSPTTNRDDAPQPGGDDDEPPESPAAPA